MSGRRHDTSNAGHYRAIRRDADAMLHRHAYTGKHRAHKPAGQGGA